MSRKFILFDTEQSAENLLPLSFTRPVADFRLGTLSIRQKWERRLKGEFGYHPMESLVAKYGDCSEDDKDLTFILGSLLPSDSLAMQIERLDIGKSIFIGDTLVAYRGELAGLNALLEKGVPERIGEAEYAEGEILKYVFDIFLQNDSELRKDFQLLTAGRESQKVPDWVEIMGAEIKDGKAEGLFIEEGAVLERCTVNLSGGPVYIGCKAMVMDGVMMRGPLSLGDHSAFKMGAKVYGGTTIGPWCKIGGEISNVVVFGYSNKAHDGYLGNAVIGEWCNLGAGVNASNLKNDYSKIRIWNYASQKFMRTDLQFCGLIMGDHSKAGINTMFNTATVVGVGCNIHGAGFPRVFVPSFSEGSATTGMKDVSLKKFEEIAERVMGRRGIAITDADRKIFENVRRVAAQFKW